MREEVEEERSWLENEERKNERMGSGRDEVQKEERKLGRRKRREKREKREGFG